MEFEFKDKKYNYIPFNDLDVSMLPARKTYKQSKYLDIGASFDIETSRINEEKLSTMYVWQFAINEITIIGRTWDEFRSLLDTLESFYKLDTKHKLLVWVHNLSWEFQYIKAQVEWGLKYKKPDIFATDDRRIVKATTKHNIEFRDSLILTQMSLDKLAKNYGLENKKIKEDTNFNYELPRHSETPLTNEELAYCIQDVQVLQEFYHKYIKKEFVRKQHQIPLTSTGIVRADLKRRYKRVPKKEKKRYERMIKRSFPAYEQYVDMITWLYRGGFTHANYALTDVVFNSFDSGIKLGAADIKSSYPASLLHYDMPSHYIEKPIEWFYKYKDDWRFYKEYSYYGTFIFRNIKAKTSHSIESKNKLMDFDNASFDNGRLIKADMIKVMLNDIDYLNYKDFYDWDEVECINFYWASKEPLPEFVKDIILQYYYYKESIVADTDDKKLLRNLTKAKLNSVYGCMVSGLLHSNLEYDPTNNIMVESDNKKSYEQIIEKEIILPQWGIYCTSLSRRAVLSNIKKIGTDCIYSDTDSIKYLDQDSHKWVFDSYNDKMHRINETMYVGNYERGFFRELGCFEDETKDARIVKFKTLGAKRYIYTTIEKGKLVDHVTVAGMRKGSLQEYCNEHNLDIYKIFKNNLKLTENESDKLTTCYEDASFEREFTDYLGNTITVSEKSCVTLYKIPFQMRLTNDYLELLEEFARLNKRRLVKRRY